ncbi:MAG: YceI family protein [Bacteroidia bacterium]|nr:YceI family protein [Bacteroidia bacterium]
MLTWYNYLVTSSILLLLAGRLAAQTWACETGQVTFRSEAPLELISASSNELKGVIDAQTRTFAFSVMIRSFQGFNSPLQQEHFNENYLESNQYPKATFSGKIIEDIDFTQPGTYTLRTKGILTIHGVAQERIIRAVVTVSGGVMRVNAPFTVALIDHQIAIPKIVRQKIAEVISVTVQADMRARR